VIIILIQLVCAMKAIVTRLCAIGVGFTYTVHIANLYH